MPSSRMLLMMSSAGCVSSASLSSSSRPIFSPSIMWFCKRSSTVAPFVAFFVDSVQRPRPARVDARGVQPRFDGVVQKHRVQHDSGRGIESEGNVRYAKQRESTGQFVLDALDRFDGFERIAAILFDSGRDRQREWIEENVGC